MDRDLLVAEIIKQLQNNPESSIKASAQSDDSYLNVVESGKHFTLFSDPNFTEFVGTGTGDTIGLVIPNIDAALRECLDIDDRYRSIGIISARSAVGPQSMGADEAVKSSNCEILLLQMPRDTKGGAGHGIFILFGAEDVSDVRRAVEITLKTLEWSFGDQYFSDVGHCEVQYTARAGKVLESYFGAELGKAWGLLCGAPAGVGLLMADRAMKAADIEIVMHCTPYFQTSKSNEVLLMFKGDSGAVKQAAMAAREAGLQALNKLGDPPECIGGKPYIV